MDLKDSPAEREFRDGLRSWLSENLPEGWNTPEWNEPEEGVAFL